MFLFVKYFSDKSEGYCFKSNDVEEVKKVMAEHIEEDLKYYNAHILLNKEDYKEIEYIDGENGVWQESYYIYYKIIEVV